VQLRPPGQHPAPRPVTSLLGRFATEAPGGELDATHRSVRRHDMQRSASEQDRPAVKGTRDVADHDEPGLSRQLAQDSDRVKTLRRPRRREMPHTLDGLEQKLLGDQRLVGVVIAREAHRELEATSVERIDDALQRRMLLPRLPTSDRRLRTPEPLSQLVLG